MNPALAVLARTNRLVSVPTHSSWSGIRDATLELHPAIVGTFFMGERSVEGGSDGRHGEDADRRAAEHGAARGGGGVAGGEEEGGGRVKVMRAKERRRGNKAVRKDDTGEGGCFITITPTAGPLHL